MQGQNKWYHKAVVYHIYPRSFKDSNNDGIGDLKGVIKKLNYLNDGTKKSLGVGAIWLSPVYKSPMADFGYDVSDYYDIDPSFGDLKTFDKLVKKAHKRGIKVMMDFVINHTSSEHPWFKESRSSRDNPKRDWYIWEDQKNYGQPPSNWRSVFGGPAWTFDEKTKQYYFHSFLPEQPDLNWRNPEVKAEMEKVIKFWLDRGVDGFRVDAIEHLTEDPDLKNDPYNPDYVPFISGPFEAITPAHVNGRRDVKKAINTLCNISETYGDKFVVSESYIDIPRMMEMYRSCSQNTYAPFNFNLMNTKWSATNYRNFIDKFEKALTPVDWPNYVFGNHDRPRLASRLDDKKSRIIAVLLLTLRGMPFIYYGDELGMTDAEIRPEEIKDPFAKRTNNIKLGRDPERSPMQWDTKKYAGFSKVKPWLPVSLNFKERNVKIEMKDPKSILNLYKSLIHFRNKSKALMHGSYKSLDAVSKDVFSYIREEGTEKILVALNFSDKSVIESLPFPSVRLVCSTCLRNKNRKLSREITLEPFEGCVMKVD